MSGCVRGVWAPEEGSMGKGHEGALRAAGNVLSLDLGGGHHTGINRSKNHPVGHVRFFHVTVESYSVAKRE